jgi:XTP/dITP diphosphohydrolase
MFRQLRETALVVASHNQGKIAEITQLLKPFALAVKSASTLNLPEPEETAASYKGNAILKARAAASASRLPALADDSGFEMMALNKAPGLYSARWAGPDKDFAAAMQKVRKDFLAKGDDDRHCRFVCALSLVWPDGHDETVEAIIDGDFVWPPRGDKGFGYDPVFQLKGDDRTFGEIDPALKQSMSHRAKAFALLLERCFQDTPKIAARDQ